MLKPHLQVCSCEIIAMIVQFYLWGQIKPKPMITLTYLLDKETRSNKLLGVFCLVIDLCLTLLITTL